MPAERYGFEVSAWVEPKFYAALREDVNRAIAEAVAAERERCAKIADETKPRDGHHLDMALRIAAAIRAD